MSATFTYEANVVGIQALTPNAGTTAGSTALTITGFGFLAGAAVTLGGSAATSIVVVSDTVITCVSPAHAAGAVDLVVTNTDTSTDTLSGGYTYQVAAAPLRVYYPAPTPPNFGTIANIHRAQGLTIHQSYGQPATCSFTTDVEPQADAFISIDVSGTNLFSGNVTSKTQHYEGLTTNLLWSAQALDYWWRLNRYRPLGEWENIGAGNILTDLFLLYAPGFTLVLDDTLPQITLTLDGSEPFTQALARICGLANAKSLLIDTAIHVFLTVPSVTAPDAITDSNLDLLRDSAGQAAEIEWDYTQIRNRLTLVGATGEDGNVLTIVLEDAASIAQYGIREERLVDNNLTTIADMQARGENFFTNYAQPIPTIRYSTRDLKTRAGLTVSVTLTRPLISGTFFLSDVNIDQINEFTQSGAVIRPRFTVTARPVSVPPPPTFNSVMAEVVTAAVVEADTSPKLTGAIESDKGGETTIPDDSIPASKLAGCIPTDKLEPGPTKDPVDTATNGNLILAGLQIVGGVQLVAGDRVLVKDQTDPTENGLYVAAVGDWTRATDADSTAQLVPGVLVAVAGGDYAGNVYVMASDSPVEIGTTPIHFNLIAGSSSSASVAAAVQMVGAAMFLTPHKPTRIPWPIPFATPSGALVSAAVVAESVTADTTIAVTLNGVSYRVLAKA